MSLFLAIEILLAGAIAVWALALAPAGLITVLKGRLDLFGWGFLTFGLAWFGGALALAPADSNWAQRRYSAEQRARAKRAFGRQRSRRAFTWWSVAAVVLVIVLGAFVVRPSPVMGVGASSLGSSLPHRGSGLFGFAPLAPCKHHGGNLWTCSLYDKERSGGTITYEVKVHGTGCWTATPTRQWDSWGKLDGCIWIFDYLG